ncbi:hypothetical protein [Denitratimonas sp. CY0512]
MVSLNNRVLCRMARPDEAPAALDKSRPDEDGVAARDPPAAPTAQRFH